MRRARRIHQRLVRWTSLSVCFALVLSCSTLVATKSHGAGFIPQGRNAQSNNGKGKKVTPEPPLAGAPAAILPNLDETRQRRHVEPQAREPLPSIRRSRRKPLESRHGLRVGDRLPPAKRTSKNSTSGVQGRMVLAHHALINRKSSAGRGTVARAGKVSHYLPGPSPMVPQSGGNQQNVSWTNVVGVSASGNSLTKTAADSWYNAGASSTQSIVSGDGYVEITASETSTYRMCGLSHGDSDQSFMDIDFAVYMTAGGSLLVFEDGNSLGIFGTYTTGDRLRVAVQAGVVKYSRNGTVFYTSAVVPTYPLLVDTSLYSNGSTLSNVVISGNLINQQNVSWTNVIGVSASGNSLTKTAADSWYNAGASSMQSIVSGDGYAEFTASETSTYRMCGLSHGDSDQSFADIDFAIYTTAGGYVSVFEDGNSLGFFGSYTTGDRLRVAVQAGVVKYSRNGTVFHTSTMAPTYPLLVDTSLYSNGSTLSNVVISGNLSNQQNVNWTNVVGVSASGNSLTKTAADSWYNAGASSTQSIVSGDGYVEITASETSTYRMCGLSHGDSDQSFMDIDFAIYMTAGGSLLVFEDGNSLGIFGSYTTGDRLRVAVQAGVVKYSRNGTVFYTSTMAPTYPLLVDTSLYSNGATLMNVVIDTGSGGSGTFSNEYTQNFIYWALLREPTTDEVNYWEDIFRAAYAHQQGSMMIAVREMARTMFESADYAARGRTNHWYVYDLYKTYLMRNPEPAGWAFWEGQCNSYGREQVRRAFDECSEFATDVAAITPNGSASSAVSSLMSARVDPNNQPGDQLLARDAEWGVSLLSLPGRAGLDLGLGLSYSSASVWSRSGPYVYFDEDDGWPSPGFRLGFPTVQEVFFDAQVGVNVRPMITSTGHRVEFRQIGTSNVYEAADSSYLQLIDSGGSLLVRSTDGIQMSYTKLQDEWRCTQIEDRNGNYLTINNYWWGDIANIVDTLGRTIVFNYDSNANLISITQNGRTDPWVTFGWSNVSMQPSLGLPVVGTYSGEVIPMLSQVGLADGSRYNFEYDGKGHVNMIRRYTIDNAQRSYTAYNYETPTNDSPRISAARIWAENWTGINGVPNEVVTTFSDPGDGSHVLTAPDGTIYKEFYGSSWEKGLVTQSEVWSGGVRQKWTTTSYTQDNAAVTYQTNPRVNETNVYDAAGNRRRATVEYNQGYGLPTQVREYGADGQTLLRRTASSYKTDSAYIDRRIIGLPYEHLVYDGPTGALMSREVFYYDWGGDYLSGQTPATNYDSANYPSWFAVGRGDLVGVRRYNCENSTTAYDDNQALWLQINGYNLAGSLVWRQDGGGHRVNISYGDSFSDGNNSRGTLAYPTTLTDADGYQSFTQYNYDFGARTRSQGPPPNNQPNGVVQTFAYDSAARLQQVTTVNTGAYTRYVYAPNYTQSIGSVNNLADDAYSVQVFDGTGRTFETASYNPGSQGGYSAVSSVYDQMGRLVKQSNPTEINGSWVPAGDDAAGWLFTQQTYDWKGRPLRTTHTDSIYKEVSYDGCGCAGGEVATLTDEVDRKQKVYSDVLGRTAKTEVLNEDSTVYATTVNTYNARDQLTLVRQYQGNDQSGLYQDTTMSYDGHGRLQSKHVPEQNVGTASVYNYNADDTIYSVTDARGATATYGYNNRHQVTSATNTLPGQNTIALTYGYDAAGNRTSMTDTLGSKSYSYNQLSQLMSETRTFDVGTFTLSYDYNLAGELKKITDPTNVTINYGFDSAGQLSGVTGSDNLYAGVATYASNLQYRAWGAAKHLNYGNSLTVDLGYNSRLQTTQYDLKTAGGAEVLGLQYQYTSTPTSTDNDGRLKYSHDLVNSNLDRTYSYDQAARLTLGDTADGGLSGPYKQTYGYDALGNLTNRSWRTFYYNQYCHCMVPQTNYSSSNYANNRNTATGWQYDADGRLQSSTDGGANFTYGYDAAGQLISNTEPGRNISQGLDGDGLKAKWVENGATTYYIRSSALGGQTIVELDQYGNKLRGYVYGGGQEIAKQEGGQVLWDQRDVSGVSMRLTNGSGGVTSKVETDPLGTQVSDTSAFNQNGGGNGYGFNPNGFYGDPTQPDMGCTEGGVPTPCNLVQTSLTAGGSYQCSGWNCPTAGWNPNRDGAGQGGFFLYRYTDEGVMMDPIGGSQSPKKAEFNHPQNPVIDASRIETLLKKPKCSDFLNGVLAELGKATGRGRAGVSFEDLFKAARGSIYGDPNWKYRASASPDGIIIGDPRFRITVNTTIETVESTATTVMHEIIHGSPREGKNYTHFEMARAAYIVGGPMGLLAEHDFPLRGANAIPDPGEADAKTDQEKWTINNHNSDLFQALLIQACDRH